MLSKNKIRLSMILPSMKFSQCQAVFLNFLRSSRNDEIKPLWKSTNSGMNIQCDVYKSTKDVLKAARSEQKHHFQTKLPFQGAILSCVLDNSLTMTTSIWTSVQSKVPKNILNFTIRYLKNSLSTHNNLKNGISHNPQNALSIIYQKHFFML